MVLHVVAPGKAYFALRFDDIPPQYIIGGACFCYGHRGSVSRFAIEARWGANMWLGNVHDRVRCLGCGNRHHNRFCVVGVAVRLSNQLANGVTADSIIAG